MIYAAGYLKSGDQHMATDKKAEAEKLAAEMATFPNKKQLEQDAYDYVMSLIDEVLGPDEFLNLEDGDRVTEQVMASLPELVRSVCEVQPSFRTGLSEEEKAELTAQDEVA